jgi:L-2-aminoadipate reductase
MNARKALYADCEPTGEDVSASTGVTEATVGLYLAYLVAIGFLPPPPGTGKK